MYGLEAMADYFNEHILPNYTRESWVIEELCPVNIKWGKAI